MSQFRPLLAAAAFGIALVSAGAADPPKPKLLVLVYFDQLRGDYLTRWHDAFGPDGFNRLTGDGAWFQNCHYPYSYTVTGAGHASVVTGCPPAVHGVIGNDWYDRGEGKSVNCVGSDRHEQVPSKTALDPTEDEKKGARGGVSPVRMTQPSIADVLKEATAGKGKVVALSMKNRGAALPGGARPDAAYWADLGVGQFVTSSYYRAAPHGWVMDYNRSKPFDPWRGKVWDRFRPDLDYAKLSGGDDQAGEGRGAAGQGRVFPHPFEPTDGKTKPNYYAAVYTSPFGNDVLLGLAEKAIAAEGLGADEVPDLLSLSFSSNDAVGHAWGPDSQEVLDTTLRSDRTVARLLQVLDEKVGKGNYVVALTADHGVCPLPEVSRAAGRTANRVPTLSGTRTEAFLVEKFGKGTGKWVQAISGPWIYLTEKTAAERGVKPVEVETAVAEWLAGQAGIGATYTRTKLTSGSPADDTDAMVRRSFHPARSGDVYVLLKPYHLASAANGTGTTHGTPHDYDTHVPLVVFGTGIKPGVRTGKVAPLAAAPILAAAAGFPRPAGATEPVPDGLFLPSSR